MPETKSSESVSISNMSLQGSCIGKRNDSQEIDQGEALPPTVSMYVRLDENIHTAYAVEVDFYIFILVSIAHPIQGSAMHIVLFIAYISWN